MTEVQRITLRDVLRETGLSERRIEDVFLLLWFKPHRVQMAFYYVSQGMTQSQAAGMVGVSQVQVSKYLRHGCSDIRTYLSLQTSHNQRVLESAFSRVT
jgi:hypothetical protein